MTLGMYFFYFRRWYEHCYFWTQFRDGLPSVMEFPSASRVRSTKGECKGEDLGIGVLTDEGAPMLKLAKYERSK